MAEGLPHATVEAIYQQKHNWLSRRAGRHAEGIFKANSELDYHGAAADSRLGHRPFNPVQEWRRRTSGGAGPATLVRSLVMSLEEAAKLEHGCTKTLMILRSQRHKCDCPYSTRPCSTNHGRTCQQREEVVITPVEQSLYHPPIALSRGGSLSAASAVSLEGVGCGDNFELESLQGE